MNSIPVHSLLGHGNMSMALRCYRSLVETTAEPLELILHDDGTLTEQDRETLRLQLPVRRMITRAEADAGLEEQLEPRPFCQRYRRAHPLALKLIDAPLLGGTEFFFCDSDILFMAPHTGLFHQTLDGAQAVFMRDIREPYSLRPWEVRPFRRQRLLSRLNTGLIAFRRADYDLDFVERFLARNWHGAGFRLRPVWIEQTAWSALASHLVCRAYDPRQIAVAHPDMRMDPAERVAIHFVSSHRGMIDAMPDRPEAGPPRLIRTVTTRLATPLGLLADELRVRWSRPRR